MSENLDRTAAERSALHRDHPSHRPLSKDYEQIGLRAEATFIATFPHLKLQIDLTKRPRGDGGFDFTVPWQTSPKLWQARRIDVKGARLPLNILVEEGHIRADVYVLAGIDDQRGDGLICWAYGHELAATVPRLWPGKVNNHIIAARNARTIRELRARLAPEET